MSELEPLTREETFLNAIAEGQTPSLDPLTREEHFLNAIATHETPTLAPMTREEYFLNKIAESGGGGGGSSDFTIATLTNNYDALPGSFVVINENPEAIMALDELAEGVYNIPLYKGLAGFFVDAFVEVEGDAELADGFLIITGDCVIKSIDD